MENKNLIIILVVIIIVLAAAIGFMALNPMHAKEPTKIKITSDKEQNEGGKLSVQLTDSNKTPLSKEIVNVTITDSKGKANLDLDLKKGKYNVTVSYGGSENYTGNNTTQKLTIKEKVAQAESGGSSSASSGGNSLEGPETDSLGITREQAERARDVSGVDVKYDSDSGLYLHYDPNTGTYHN